ncbi:MAG TPA: hypothetical protein VK864_06810 [Longimicrobiales bacterium]|nr:hypothetical protein [Longimicrobiales bacterium]
MARSPGVSALVALALAGALAVPASAQGGWRQWDVYLRDGTRHEANPLGAPDSMHVSLSVGAFASRDSAIPRARVDYIAAQSTVGPSREPLPGVVLPAAPTGRACADIIVYRDGRKTKGHVTLTRIAFSEGVVSQNGRDVDLQDVAFIKFRNTSRRKCRLAG